MSDIESHSSTFPTVPNVPIYLDKDPIIWDENKATIPGVQHGIRAWLKRTGKYKTLFTNRTAPCGHGKLAIDHPDTLVFLTDPKADPRSYEDPPPQTPDRLKARGLKTYEEQYPDANAFEEMKTVGLVFAPHVVDDLNASLFNAISHAYSHAESVHDIMEECNADGLALMRAIDELGATADAGPRGGVAGRSGDGRGRVRVAPSGGAG